MGLFSTKMVIVEDNAALAEIYQVRMELLGYKCYVAHDGLAGITLIEKERPDIVLLDLMLPILSGDEVLARMRATDWGKDIKVLIISNLNESEAPGSVRQSGISGYVVKANLSNDQLDGIVSKILTPS